MHTVYYVKSFPSYEELSTSVKGMTKQLMPGYVGTYSEKKVSMNGKSVNHNGIYRQKCKLYI